MIEAVEHKPFSVVRAVAKYSFRLIRGFFTGVLAGLTLTLPFDWFFPHLGAFLKWSVGGIYRGTFGLLKYKAIEV